MKDQNEPSEKQVVSPEIQTDNNSAKKIPTSTVLYYIINIIYFLAFLGSCPSALLAPFAFAFEEGINTWIGFLFLAGTPFIILGIMWSARSFYQKGMIKASFQVLLIPPLLYLIIFLILQAIYDGWLG